ncbi:MAG TPA: HAD family hydrolase [Phycisphaerae bacterium]|nr:HAD family hydrolase [Phycisphaerae bacterium]
MTYRAVLFDLDGTLLDTVEDLTDAMNAALGQLGCPARTLTECKRFVGDGLRMFASRALPDDRRDEATLERCCDVFRDAYAACWNVKTRAYDGISDLLDALTERGLALTVLSNKPDEFTRMMVRAMLADWRFAAVRGVRPDGVRKPDPAGALEIAEGLGIAPAAFLYLGDTDTDMQTARAARMFPVGATWGFRPPSELTAHGAGTLIDHPLDLLDLL